ncbi:MAG: hypothetical protein ACPGTQ_09830 [Colwellia sp.]
MAKNIQNQDLFQILKDYGINFTVKYTGDWRTYNLCIGTQKYTNEYGDNIVVIGISTKNDAPFHLLDALDFTFNFALPQSMQKDNINTSLLNMKNIFEKNIFHVEGKKLSSPSPSIRFGYEMSTSTNGVNDNTNWIYCGNPILDKENNFWFKVQLSKIPTFSCEDKCYNYIKKVIESICLFIEQEHSTGLHKEK